MADKRMPVLRTRCRATRVVVEGFLIAEVVDDEILVPVVNEEIRMLVSDEEFLC